MPAADEIPGTADLGTSDLDTDDLATDAADAADAADEETDEDADDGGFLDRLRGGGVGTEDPMIVGDAGPTDIPPGRDGQPLLVSTDEPVDHLEV